MYKTDFPRLPREPREAQQFIGWLQHSLGFSGQSSLSQLREIFDFYVRPALYDCVIRGDADTYSALDHLLFSTFIVCVEDQDWFDYAFNAVNEYGHLLGTRLSSSISSGKQRPTLDESTIFFIFKGPLKLAHADFFLAFLSGKVSSEYSHSNIHVVFIDQVLIPNLPEGISYHSLAGLPSTVAKLSAFQDLQRRFRPINTVWVACIQNISLYLACSLSQYTTYWTMKRHTVILPSITNYATLLSSHKNTVHNGVYWFGGRSIISFKTSKNNKYSNLAQLLPSTVVDPNVYENTVFLGALARQQKYQSLDYWRLVERVLATCAESFYIYGTQKLSDDITSYINQSQILSSRSYNLGWLNGQTQDAASLIDIYLDTTPFGSGVPAAEAILQGAAYLGLLSDINLEMSLINLIIEYSPSSINNYNPIGLLKTMSDIETTAVQLVKDKSLRLSISEIQQSILNSAIKDSCHFTNDYLKYFLDPVKHKSKI